MTTDLFFVSPTHVLTRGPIVPIPSTPLFSPPFSHPCPYSILHPSLFCCREFNSPLSQRFSAHYIPESCMSYGSNYQSSVFRAPIPLAEDPRLVHPRPMGRRLVRGVVFPSGEQRGSTAPGEDKVSCPNQKSFLTSTAPANRGQNRRPPGSISPRTVCKPQPRLLITD